MECKKHEGQEANLICAGCGQNYCRECLKETGGSYYCPDCYRAELEGFAARLGVRPAEPADAVEKTPVRRRRAGRERRAAAVPTPEEPERTLQSGVQEERARKQLRKPIVKAQAPPPLVTPRSDGPEPPPSPAESDLKRDFWGDGEPARRVEQEAVTGPFFEEPAGAAVEPPAEPVEAVKPDVPVPPAEEKPRYPQQTAPPSGEPLVPEGRPRRAARHARRATKPATLDRAVAMQLPDEYDGAVTGEPSYPRAVLWGLLAGALGAGAYAGFAFWRHREYAIFGWVIGVAVGLAVVFASGRHFNWKLGLIAAGTAFFFISAGRILLYMLTVWFPDIEFFNLPLVDNFNHAVRQFAGEFFSLWLVFFLIAGAMAFLLSFRPWPIRFRVSGEAPPRATRRRAST